MHVAHIHMNFTVTEHVGFLRYTDTEKNKIKNIVPRNRRYLCTCIHHPYQRQKLIHCLFFVSTGEQRRQHGRRRTGRGGEVG